MYRPNKTKGWAERCFYLDENFSSHIPYNHRSILLNEVVIEFDEEDKQKNKELSDSVARRLTEDGYAWSKWYSGNKSTHLHTFIDFGDVSNLALLKKCFMRYYSQGLGITPDLQLASNNHLIRAEYGIHEGTGKKKTLISSNGTYPTLNRPSQGVWELYRKEQAKISKMRITNDLKDIEKHVGFNHILNSDKLRTSDDGRERAMFVLIHVLKGKYTNRKQEFISFLQQWYKYSSGRKLSPDQIARKVHYHWNRNYTITQRYLNELMESIGRKDLCEE